MYIDIAVNITHYDKYACNYNTKYKNKRKYKNNKKYPDVHTIMVECRKRDILPILVSTGEMEWERVNELCESYGVGCYVGVHPCRAYDELCGYNCDDNNNDSSNDCGKITTNGNNNKINKTNNNEQISTRLSTLQQRIKSLLGNSKVLAIGECGTDTERLHFSPVSYQKMMFLGQIGCYYFGDEIVNDKKVEKVIDDKKVNDKKESTGPAWDGCYFMHMRGDYSVFEECITENDNKHCDGDSEKECDSFNFNILNSNNTINIKNIKGVIHSITAPPVVIRHILTTTPFFIGINGLSLRLVGEEALKAIPLERILLETDAPYCRPKKPYFVDAITNGCINDDTNNTINNTSNTIYSNKVYTPMDIPLVYESVARIYNISVDALKRQIRRDFIACFGERGRKLVKRYERECNDIVL